MSELWPRAKRLRVGCMVLAISGLALVCGAAGADTIYLKNGGLIHTASVSIEDGRVVFLQYGQPMAVPLSQVDRIEENDTTGPVATSPRRAAVETAATEEAAAEPASPLDVAATMRQDPEYWRDRVREIDAERQALELELMQLRRIERAFLFSHRSTADTRRQIEEVQERIEANRRALPDLRREARRQGVPPGWLRLPG